MSLPTPERRRGKIAARALNQTEFSARTTHCLTMRQLAWRSAPPADRAKARHDWLQAFPVAQAATASRYRRKAEAEHPRPELKRRTAQDMTAAAPRFLHVLTAARRRIHRASAGMHTARWRHPYPAKPRASMQVVHCVAKALHPPTPAMATHYAKAQGAADSPAPTHPPALQPAGRADRRGWHRPPRVDAAMQAMPATPAFDSRPAKSLQGLPAKASNQAHARECHAPAIRHARGSIPIHRHPRHG